MTDYAIYLDTSKCTGCKGCQVACKCWNNLPSPLGLNANPFTHSYQAPADLNGDTRLIVTFAEHDNNEKWGVNWSIGRRSCMHCIDPACVKVCSSGALFVDESTGFVAVDEAKCIGCEYCTSACPFDVPRFHGAENKVNKCNACMSRLHNGKTPAINDGTGESVELRFAIPACVHTCPAGALSYGPRDEILAQAHERLEFLKNHPFKAYPEATIYGENELSGLHVITLLKYPAETYGLPADPQVNPLNDILDVFKPLTGIAAAGTVAGLALCFLMGLGYKRHTLHYDNEKHQTIDMDTDEVVWSQDAEAPKERSASDSKGVKK